jgi:hypothetical protein
MTGKGKLGRKKKAVHEKHSHAIKFTCTPAEYTFFQANAEKANYAALATFLHDVCIEVVESGHFSYNEQTKVNSELLAVLIGLANNVNQAMHVVHVHGIENLPNFHKSLQKALQIIIDMGQIATLGVRRECHIDDQNQEMSNGNA